MTPRGVAIHRLGTAALKPQPVSSLFFPFCLSFCICRSYLLSRKVGLKVSFALFLFFFFACFPKGVGLVPLADKLAEDCWKI